MKLKILLTLLMISVGAPAYAQCSGQPASGLVCGNSSASTQLPAWNTLTLLFDRGIGSTQGTVLNRGASSWSATATPSLGKNGGTGGAITLNGTTSGSSTIGVKAAAGTSVFNLPVGNGTSGYVLSTDGAGNTSWLSIPGTGTVQSVGLALPSSILTVSGSPIVATGTLTGTLATQSANSVWAGPTTGSAATPTFRSLVGADLPNPSPTTLGGVESLAALSSNWIRSISTSGVPAASQPAFSDISGSVAAAQLPNPTATTLGGIESFASVAHQWINQISTSGVPSSTQAAFSDLSGVASLGQLPAIGNNTILSNISGGTAQPAANGPSSLIDVIGSAQGDILYRNASSWTVLAPGTSGQVLSTGGAAANPAWTTVAGTGTVTSVATNNGLTGGAITSSGTIGLAPISTGNVLAYTGGGTGVPVATAPTSILDVIGATEGDILYRGASSWGALAPGSSGQFLQTQGSGSTPQWSTAVTGPGSSVSGHVATFNGTSGGVIQDGGPLSHISALGSANVSGSAQNTTGTISASSTALTLASAIDFKNGEGIRIDHAGASSTKGAPSSLTVTPTGTAGTTHYTYTIASFDAAGGVGAAIATVTTTTGNATLSTTNYNALSWSAGSGSPAGYAVYGNASGCTTSTCTLLAVVPGTTFSDMGTTVTPGGVPTPPDWLPSAAQPSALADWLVTTVSSGGGTTSLALAASSTTAATSQAVYHDDTTAVQTALNTAQSSNVPFYLDPGTYYTTAALTCASARCSIYGASMYNTSIIRAMSLQQDGISLSAAVTGNHLHDFSIYSGNGSYVFATAGALIRDAATQQANIYERINAVFGYQCFNLSSLLPAVSLPDALCSNVVIAVATPGDSYIRDALDISGFSIPGASVGAVGILQTGDPGGLKIINNKFNVAGIGAVVAVQINASISDGDLLITGNSIEGWSTAGVEVNVSGGAQFGNIVINGNQIGGGAGAGPIAVYFPGNTAGLSKILINNNVLQANAGYAVAVGNIADFTIQGNVLKGTTGIQIGSASATGCGIGLNIFSGVTTQISDASGACTYAAVTTTKPTYP